MFDAAKYVHEEHEVITEDGYKLTMFRINLVDSEKAKLPEAQKKNIGRPIVLNHGLLDSSDGFFLNGDKSVGFHLLDQGYDIWSPNNRGNKYSLDHVDPEISYSNFWDFCWDEMAEFDVPANINYVIAKTGKEKLTWIGHSEGTSQMFGAAADPKTKELVDKRIDKFIALAPIVFMKHCESPVLAGLAQFRHLLWPVFQITQLFNFVPSFCLEKPGFAKLGQMFCDTLPFICDNIVPGVHFNPKVDDILKDLTTLITHYPAGTAAKNVMKYAQSISNRKENRFTKYDYGHEGNMKKYGTKSPGLWDVTKIAIDTVLIAGTNDMLGNPVDVGFLSSIMRDDLTDVHFITDYDHISFLFPVDPTEMFALIDKHLSQ